MSILDPQLISHGGWGSAGYLYIRTSVVGFFLSAMQQQIGVFLGGVTAPILAVFRRSG